MRPFGVDGWKVYPDRDLIVRGDLERTVQTREMDLLVRLAAAGGEVVRKEELLRDVWEDRLVVEHVLPKTVSSLRRAFGETARASRVVLTVPRRGYRIGSPIVRIDDDSARFRPTPVRRTGVKAAALAGLCLGLSLLGHVPGGTSQSLSAEIEGTQLPVRVEIVPKWQHKIEIAIDTAGEKPTVAIDATEG